ncbi:MAG: Rpn family recombination-promoting nuclease/putative transposase [Clostridia bacterium]|nr:Rpn family recombination-promoting nuclease/putative transposase [Clostridia bacterium]
MSKIIKIKHKGVDIIELLELKNDYTFKRVFGFTGNEEITKDLVSAILKEPVNNIELNCKEILEREVFDDKLGILDIRAKLNNNIDCDIEMQVVDQKNIEKRLLFYLSRMYGQNVRKGQEYKDANKCIAILFTDFNIEKLKPIKKYKTKWNFREEDYSDVVLTDAMEIHIIELSKIQKYSENKELDIWVNFINGAGDFDMSKANEQVKKAKEVLEEISENEHEQYLAHLREKYILDQNNLLSSGYERGLEQGTRNERIEIAKKLKEKKVDIEIIIETTGLTKEEIERL